MDKSWTSRKLAVALILSVIATGLLIAGLIDQETWKWVQSGTVIAYLGAQGLTDALGALRK